VAWPGQLKLTSLQNRQISGADRQARYTSAELVVALRARVLRFAHCPLIRLFCRLEAYWSVCTLSLPASRPNRRLITLSVLGATDACYLKLPKGLVKYFTKISQFPIRESFHLFGRKCLLYTFRQILPQQKKKNTFLTISARNEETILGLLCTAESQETLYRPANDPPGPQMIPRLYRKWSRTENGRLAIKFENVRTQEFGQWI